MGYSDYFFKALNINPLNKSEITRLSKSTGIPVSRLINYNDTNTLPSGKDLDSLIKATGIDFIDLMLKMGRLDMTAMKAVQDNAMIIKEAIKNYHISSDTKKGSPDLVFKTKLGKLYEGDCIAVMKAIESDSVDLIFADPPFNLNKLYPSKINDSLKAEYYLHWCEEWLSECIRILKQGGSLFLWNLPIWNTSLSAFLNGRLTFRHWISADIKYTLPIQGRLYPSHYSLLYYIKGEKPNIFHPDRLPMPVCPKCYFDMKDYGGYKDKMNPKGINLSDVWLDIPPVRHAKYKRRNGANELSLKLLDRIIEMSSDKGQLIFDPFGGSGTTYIVAEIKGRKWIGSEIGPVDDIIARFSRANEEREILKKYRKHLNSLFPDAIKGKRKALGLWTCDSFISAKKNSDEKERKLPIR